MVGDGVWDRLPEASTWDWVFGGQTQPTGGEVELRAGRPWSVAREILRSSDASAVPRCPDQRVQEPGLGGHGCHQNPSASCPVGNMQ